MTVQLERNENSKTEKKKPIYEQLNRRKVFN